MRLWSIHPRYLDRQGLLAVWREGLLAQKVLEGNTRGYIHHPQLDRFRGSADALGMIGSYLALVAQEATVRGYRFEFSKIHKTADSKIPVNRGQVEYEWSHLRAKLSVRDSERFGLYDDVVFPELHPIFFLVEGGIEDWERI